MAQILHTVTYTKRTCKWSIPMNARWWWWPVRWTHSCSCMEVVLQCHWQRLPMWAHLRYQHLADVPWKVSFCRTLLLVVLDKHHTMSVLTMHSQRWCGVAAVCTMTSTQYFTAWMIILTTYCTCSGHIVIHVNKWMLEIKIEHCKLSLTLEKHPTELVQRGGRLI